MSAHEHEDGPSAVVDHLRAAGAQAAIVVDGNGDRAVETLAEMGYELERVEYVAGKRIRIMRAVQP